MLKPLGCMERLRAVLKSYFWILFFGVLTAPNISRGDWP